MPNVYEASDYAGLVAKNLDAYYGYEQTTGEGDDAEWCFVASVNGKEIARIPESKLGARDQFNCEENLLCGLAILLDTHQLVPEIYFLTVENNQKKNLWSLFAASLPF